MEYKVISSSSPEGLSIAVSNHILEGWNPIGSHQVVMHHSQNRYSGQQHMDTRHQADYSQTMVREVKKVAPSGDISPELQERLFTAVLEQISTDVSNGEVGAIEELLRYTPIKDLIEFLPEEDWSKFKQ